MATSPSSTQSRELQYQTSYDGSAFDQPTRAVVEAIATLEDVSPLELDPLYNYVDPDALNLLFTDREEAPTGPTVEFVVEGWLVQADAAGTVSVYTE